jgi:uncharacterized membrane protein
MTTSRDNDSLSRGYATGWVGWIVFAAIMMFIVGAFNIIDGLAALFKDEVFVNTGKGLLVFDLTAFGWIHLLLGVLQCFVGAALLNGATWGRIAAVVLVGFNAIEQLVFLSAYPFWSMLIIAIDVLVIWALIVHGEETRELA